MNHQMELCAFIALATLAMAVADSNYLAEKPDFIKSCRRKDPGFNSCFGKNFEMVLREWKDGVPGLKSVGTTDPLFIKRISVKQTDDNPLVQMNLNLHNVKLTGISLLEIKDMKIDFDTGKGLVKIRAPKVGMDADYDIKGRILNLPLDGKGKASVQINDFTGTIQMILKLRDDFGYTFADVVKLRLEIADIGGFHMNLENLFNGQKDLEESTNLVINENWRDFYSVMAPAITESIQNVLFDLLKKVFAYVPAQYFVEDIQTAAELNG